MAKRPVVNEDLCIGCSHCQEVCPKVFQLEDEKSQVIGARTRGNFGGETLGT